MGFNRSPPLHPTVDTLLSINKKNITLCVLVRSRSATQDMLRQNTTKKCVFKEEKNEQRNAKKVKNCESLRKLPTHNGKEASNFLNWKIIALLTVTPYLVERSWQHSLGNQRGCQVQGRLNKHSCTYTIHHLAAI